ncbi:hypothetical protein B9K06_12580 [Bacillus sp. OG2]|nr:hypothetical protein B9K06_12580 [Bacillus sp. OG2]
MKYDKEDKKIMILAIVFPLVIAIIMAITLAFAWKVEHNQRKMDDMQMQESPDSNETQGKEFSQSASFMV